jgi:hypothetical protein
MGKRLIIKTANFMTNSIDNIDPSVIYYSITYNLINASTDNTTTSILRGSSYSVTLTPNTGYVISSATVTHNGQTVNPTSDYTYEISSVVGNIVVECTANFNPKTITQNDWAYSLENTCYIAGVDKDKPGSYVCFVNGDAAKGAGFALLDLEIYRGHKVRVVNSGTIDMRVCMFNNGLIPSNIPNMASTVYQGTNLAPYLASGWTDRGSVLKSTTSDFNIPSDGKWFYFNYLTNGNPLTYTITIIE